VPVTGEKNSAREGPEGRRGRVGQRKETRSTPLVVSLVRQQRTASKSTLKKHMSDLYGSTTARIPPMSSKKWM
jgi:hypothetical protein